MRIKVFFIFVLICATLAPLATWAQVDRIELGYQTTRRGIVWYRPGLPTRAPEWKFSRDTNAVLWVDTLTALRYDWDYLDNVWRTKGTAKGATPPLPVQTSGTATIDNRSAYWLRDTFNLIHKYDSTASAWTPWGDWFYLASVPTDIDLTGAHGAARYRRSLWQNNSTFEVRYWDGDSWEPFAGTADGSETIVTAGTGIGVTGTGTSGNPYIVTNTGDLSATNEIQSLTAGGAGPTAYTLDLSLGGGAVTLTEGSNIDLNRSGNNITIAVSGLTADTSKAWATNTFSVPDYYPTLTEKIFHNGPVLIATDTAKFRWYASGLGQAKADSVKLYIRTNNTSSDNTPAVYVRQYANGPYNPFAFDMDSLIAPAATPFAFFQSYYPAASSAGDNPVYGFGFNIDKNTNRLISGKPYLYQQYEGNFAARTAHDMEWHVNFGPTTSGAYRPAYSTCDNVDGGSSYWSFSANTHEFYGGGADAALLKGAWNMDDFTMQNPNTNGQFGLFLKGNGTGSSILRMRNPNGGATLNILTLANGQDYVHLSESAKNVKLGSPVFSFDFPNAGNAILSSRYNAGSANDTLNFGWDPTLFGSPSYTSFYSVRYFLPSTGAIFLGNWGSALNQFSAIGKAADDFYINTGSTGSSGSPSIGIDQNTGNVGIRKQLNTIDSDAELQIGGKVQVDVLSGTPAKIVGSTSTNILTNITIGTGLSFSNDTLNGGGITGTGMPTQVAFWGTTTSITGDNNLWWDNTSKFLGIGYNAPGAPLQIGSNAGGSDYIQMNNSTGGTPLLRMFNSGLIDAQMTAITFSQDAAYEGFSLNTNLEVNGKIFTNQEFAAVGLNSIGTGVLPGQNTPGGAFRLRPAIGNPAYINFVENGEAFRGSIGFAAGSSALTIRMDASTFADGTERFRFTNDGKLGVSSNNPQRTLHVAGEARITDLVTDTPTQVVGADADGDLSVLGLSGISIIAGVLTVPADGDGSSTNEGVLGVAAGGANDALLTSNTSGAVGVTYSGGSGITITETTSTNGGTITITNSGDLSATNEAWTIDADDADTEVIGNQTVKFQGAGILSTDYNPATDVLLLTATEIDGSVSNELQTYSHAGTTSYTNTLSSGGGSFTLQSGGIVTLSHSAGTTTISAAEVDGSITNEIQVLSAGGAGPTSYTLDLSLSGGSVTLSEGSGIDLSRSGNTITIASTAGPTYYQTLLDDGAAMTQQPNENFVSTTDISFTLTNDGINTETEVSADIPANAVDYAEIQQAAANKLIGNPTGSTANVTEIGLATGLSFSGGNLTPADNSATNELQVLANTSNTTTHTVTLSNSGGSVQLAEGSGVTLTTTGTTLDGVVTVAATDASATNEIQALTAGDGTGDNRTLELSLGGGTVTLDPAGILTISRSTNTLTLTATEVDGDASNELQTLASSSDATSHTVTLSNSGGSLKLVEGANVTLTTTGTALDGIVTIAATSGSGTDLSFSGASSPVTLNSSTGTDVTMTAGGIVSMSATSGNITISATEIDGSVTNEIQSISAGDGAGDNKTIDLSLSGGTITLDPAGIFTISRSGNTLTMTGTEVDGSTTNEALTISDGTNSEALGGQTLTVSGAGINVASYSIATNTLTITGTEVDGSVTNEGTLGVGAGGASSSVVTSNTSGATGVTINAAGIITISESTSSNGGSITLTGTEVDGSTTNELQTLSNTSNTTSHTVTLSSSGGSVQLVEGSNITLTTTGTTADGIVTIAATPSSGDGNGIYGDGVTPGSGSSTLPPGGSTVTLPGQWQPLQFSAATAAGQVWTALQVNAATCSDDRFTKYLVGKSPSDSLEIYNFDCGAWIKETGGQMTLQTDKEMMLVADSFNMTTVPARTILPYVLGITAGGWVDKIAGTSTGQILQWNNTGSYWEIGSPPGGGTVSGTGSAGQATYWTGTTTIAGENNHWWDSTNDRLGIGTNGATPSSSVDITKNSLGTTQTTTSGLALVNTTAAAAGAQQISPALRFSGNGWKTTATAASQPIEFRAYANPVQGTTAPTGYLGFGSGVNGSFTDNQINFSTTGEIGVNVTDFTSAGAVAKINVNGGTTFTPFVFNTWGTASSSGGVVYGQVANTLTTSSTFFSLNEQANINTVRAGLRRFGSTHTTRPGELNLVNIVGSPVTIGTNDITRMTVDADGTVYTSAKLAAGFASTTGIHSTVQSAGSIATAYLETVGAPTFDDTKRTVIYTASTNISWTLPTATACNCPGREYILHHAGTAGTVTLSQSINKGNAGNFNTLTAGQWAYIIYGTSGGSIRGYKITSL